MGSVDLTPDRLTISAAGSEEFSSVRVSFSLTAPHEGEEPNPSSRVTVRLIPHMAKALLVGLGEAVESLEERLGPIDVSRGMEEEPQ